MCIHAWGSPPIPPTPTKNLKAQILLEAEIWHIMSLDAKLQIFSSKFEVVVGGCLASDPPTTTPKLQLDFKSKKSSCSLGVVVVGGVWHQTPPPPPLNFNLTLSQKSQVVVYGWWWGWGVWTSLQPILAHSTFERMTNVCLHISCDDIIINNYYLFYLHMWVGYRFQGMCQSVCLSLSGSVSSFVTVWATTSGVGDTENSFLILM